MIALLASITVAFCIAVLWVSGIGKMHDKHPDYEGEDMFNESKEDLENENTSARNN